jgi:hypothetical protein
LLSDVTSLEQRLLHFLGGKDARFSPVAWIDVPEHVFLPSWRKQREGLQTAFAGLRWADLPEALRQRGSELARAAHGLSELVPHEHVAQALQGPIGACLTAALADRGWSIAAAPGDPVSASKNDERLEPFALVSQLLTDDPSAGRFAAWTVEEGIAALPIAG